MTYIGHATPQNANMPFVSVAAALALLVLPRAANAHYPRFATGSYPATAPFDANEDDEWQKQSIGVYVDEQAAGAVFHMNLGKMRRGEWLDISVSVPSHLYTAATTSAMNITGVALAPCEKDWDGWGNTDDDDARRRLAVTEAPAPEAKAKLEPFAVGYYTPLRACRAEVTAESTADIIVTVLVDPPVRFTVGVGMAEQFANFIWPDMQVHIAEVWVWFGRTCAAVLAPAIVGDVFGAALVTLLSMTTMKKRQSQQGMKHDVLYQNFLFFGAAFTFGSPVSFVVAISWTLDQTGNDWTSKMWMPVIMHVLLPLLCIALVTYRMRSCVDFFGVAKMCRGCSCNPTCTTITTVAAVLYLLLMTWQSYWLGDIFLVLGLLLWCFHDPKKPSVGYTGSGGSAPIAAEGRALSMKSFRKMNIRQSTP